jgi:glycosyltransferase involved in cell wall biosynthesis
VKVAVVAAVVPNPDSGGGAITTWSVAKHLVDAGHEVTVLTLHDPVFDDAAGRTLEQRLDQVRSLGADAVPVESRSRTAPRRRIAAVALRARDDELLPHLLDASSVRDIVRGLSPDVAFAYGWDAVAATRGLRGDVRRLGCVVDLAHLPELYRFRRDPKPLSRATLGRALLLQAMLRRLPRLQVELLNECEASADFAKHHAEWLRRRGATRTQYLRTPIWDKPGPGWRTRRADGQGRILLIGHLRGTSTQDGLDFFLEDVLPRLESRLDRFEIRLAGGFEPPPDLARRLRDAPITLLGHLPDPDEEFHTADCIVVPTTIPLGARVRIVTALSFGCPLIVHRSNAYGIAELEHERNSLIGGDAESLAGAIVRALREPELRARLSENGRATYERCFSLPVAGRAIEDVLVSIADHS